MRQLWLVLPLILLAPTVASAQQRPPMTEEQKAEAFQEAFNAGLNAIRQKNYALGVRAFQFCIRLYPERPTAYYNIACCYSLQNKKKEALDMIEKALEKGFSSFEHMVRDTDLDNIRKDARFIALVEKYKKKLVESSKSLMIEPKGEGKAPLLVFLHGRGQKPDLYRPLLEKASAELGFGVLLPRGDANLGEGFRWSQGAETTVLAQLRRALATGRYDASKVMIGGFSSGAYEALDIALHNPSVFKGVLSFAAFYDESQLGAEISGAASKGLKVFLASGTEDPLHSSAVEGRDALAKGGVAVILRRFKGGHRIPEDFRRMITEATKWIGGGEAPEFGAPRRF